MGAFTLGEVHQLFPRAMERTYHQGQIVVYDGDQPRHVVFVKSGAYKFYDIDENGNEKILSIDGTESIFPLFYTFEDKDHVDAFYATLSRSTFIMIPVMEFREVLQKNAELSWRLLKWYASQMDHTIIRLKSLEKSTARHKLLHALLYLCSQPAIRRALGDGWYAITFSLSQQTLADLTGLTRETVNANLRAIEAAGAIRNPRKLVMEMHQATLEGLLSF